MEEILLAHEQMEHDMEFRHKWVPRFYNWVIALLVVILFGSFVWWGLDIHSRHMADEMLATTLAEMDAEHEQMLAAAEAEQAAIKASEEHIMTEEAKVIAKAFYGIRNFVEKYGYTTTDLETYARCIFNRAEATGQSIEEVVSKKDQFLGYAEGNQLVKEYYDQAIRFVNDWHNEEVKPCDSSYQWAELNEDGIWLRNSFKADGYARRWHA